jgi:hypothetical protein
MAEAMAVMEASMPQTEPEVAARQTCVKAAIRYRTAYSWPAAAEAEAKI